MIEDWVKDNMHGVLIAIEVMWVAGFVAVFVLYFVLKRHFKAKAKAKSQAEAPVEALKHHEPPN